MLQIANSLKDSLAPDIMPFVNIRAIEMEGKQVIEIDVVTGTNRPYYIREKGLKPSGVYVRKGSSYEAARSLHQQLTFETAEAEMQRRNIDFGAAQMRTLRLIGGDGLYTNLAYILSDQFETSIKVALFQGTDKAIFRDRKEFSGSILKQLEKVYQFIDLHNKTRATFFGLDRIDTRAYPEEAVREALFNSLVHRDYSVGASNLINIYDDRIEFVSVGGLVSGLELKSIDYLEEYIEQIIMDGFCEKEFKQLKLQFIEDMINKSSLKDSDWSRSYHMGKWAIRYLEIVEKQKNSKAQIEEFCRKYWDNSSVRRYYIDFCMKNRDYVHALEVLDESISTDKAYRGLIAEYSKKKKDIFLLQGDKNAYIGQLWKLILEDEAGSLDIYRELKKQYTIEEWTDKREELFKKLPKYAHIDQLYKEEKLYDRLLEFVMQSTGLYTLQQYENVLKREYPEQLLQKYKTEVNNMAIHTGDRKKYRQLVAILRKMKKIRGGSKIVEDIVAEWKDHYRNRPAMMDELSRL